MAEKKDPTMAVVIWLGGRNAKYTTGAGETCENKTTVELPREEAMDLIKTGRAKRLEDMPPAPSIDDTEPGDAAA